MPNHMTPPPVGRHIDHADLAVRHRRWQRRLVLAVGIPLLLVVGGVGVAVAGGTTRVPNPNCALIVPPRPLTAAGLATPYRLVATDPDQGSCHQANPDQAAFVQATILDPTTGAISVYSPLVIDGRGAAVPPTPPALPPGAVVGIWFGSNGDTLTLRGSDRTLRGAHCVNGLRHSLFGQFAYCNAAAFFQAANAAITAGTLVPPTLGTARDGLPCPSVRDFAVVDQDQSDNVTSTYLMLPGGRTAQNTAANRTRLGSRATVLANGSDNRLLDAFIDPALGCAPPTAPDLADPGARATSLALNELSAAAHQASPIALVPTDDPMTTVTGRASVAKTNLYRVGVDQPALPDGVDTSTDYCTNLVTAAPTRLRADRPFTEVARSPQASAANLYAFLAARLSSSYDELGCEQVPGLANPVTLRIEAGVVVDATWP